MLSSTESAVSPAWAACRGIGELGRVEAAKAARDCAAFVLSVEVRHASEHHSRRHTA
jgi:hypothetical protein